MARSQEIWLVNDGKESGVSRLQRAMNPVPAQSYSPAIIFSRAGVDASRISSFARRIVGEGIWKRSPFHRALAARLRDAQRQPDANSAAAGTAQMNAACPTHRSQNQPH